MGAYPLSSPGDVSEWGSLGDVYEKAGGDSKETADKLRGIELKIKVLNRREKIRLSDSSKKSRGLEDGADKEIAILDSDEQWIWSGVSRIRGVGRDIDNIDEEILEALAASHLTWIVALAVRMYNELDSDARQGFFAPAQEA